MLWQGTYLQSERNYSKLWDQCILGQNSYIIFSGVGCAVRCGKKIMVRTKTGLLIMKQTTKQAGFGTTIELQNACLLIP